MSEFTYEGGGWDFQQPEHDVQDHDLNVPGLEHGLGVGLAGTADYSEPTWYGAGDGTSGEIGNPAQYAHDWFYQQADGYCVPSSLTQVIEAQTGTHLDGYGLVEQELARLGLPSTGLTLPQAQEALSGFGVPSHIVDGGNPQAATSELEGYLEQGRNVVLGVNASPIWYGEADSSDNPGGQADHALVVSAIDPQTQTVTLSDPGTPDGNEEQVPMSTFLEAWSASGYSMLVTDHADPAAGAGTSAASATGGQETGAVPAPGEPTAFGDIVHDAAHMITSDWAILPISLTAEWLATRWRA